MRGKYHPHDLATIDKMIKDWVPQTVCEGRLLATIEAMLARRCGNCAGHGVYGDTSVVECGYGWMAGQEVPAGWSCNDWRPEAAGY